MRMAAVLSRGSIENRRPSLLCDLGPASVGRELTG